MADKINERVRVIVPTAINVVTAVNDTLITLTRRGTTAEVALPSLRRRALLIVAGTGLLPIQDVNVSDDNFTR